MNTKLKPVYKDKLLKALEEKKQARGRLRRGDCMCIYGVMCDISGVGKWTTGTFERKNPYYKIEGEAGPALYATSLPYDVRNEVFEEHTERWGGAVPFKKVIEILGEDAVEEIGIDLDTVSSNATLARLNDDGVSFEELSKIIDELF